ncbi:hypothetical protein UlMin_030894 [Ulmus minor]
MSLFSFFSFLPIILLSTACSDKIDRFTRISLVEASIDGLRLAFKQNKLTSREVVAIYLERIQRLNPILKGVIEVNPDAFELAEKADHERRIKAPISLSKLHGIPVLVKDNIATKDKLNTTAGSFALLGSVVPRDAGVVTKLREAGAIILGKASLSEWSFARSDGAPAGWSARGGQGVNPYNSKATPCSSSSGPAISTAANLVTVTLGTETDGSILCPSSLNSVVGIKPTVGLTSRSGVVPFSRHQDSVGPICRTVSDAAYVLDAIVGIDKYDTATIEASKYIPRGGYAQFLKRDGLKGKRIGIVRHPYFEFNFTVLNQTFEQHFQTLRQEGAVVIDHLKIPNIDEIMAAQSEKTATVAEFKMALNAYLLELETSPVRSLADVIDFNNKNAELEKVKEYGQGRFIAAEATNGIGKAEKEAFANMVRETKCGFVKLMTEYKLDALVGGSGSAFPYTYFSQILAIGSFPGISVPAGYFDEYVPFGIFFGGLKGSEPTLIQIAYGFEQATKVRKPPPFK